jgi:hypothetical protein
MDESEDQISLTREAPRASGRAKNQAPVHDIWGVCVWRQ